MIDLWENRDINLKFSPTLALGFPLSPERVPAIPINLESLKLELKAS